MVDEKVPQNEWLMGKIMNVYRLPTNWMNSNISEGRISKLNYITVYSTFVMLIWYINSLPYQVLPSICNGTVPQYIQQNSTPVYATEQYPRIPNYMVNVGYSF